MLIFSCATREPLPGSWDTELDSFQKMIVLKCLRTDKITEAMQDYVAANLGQRFIEPQVMSYLECKNFLSVNQSVLYLC